MGSRQRQKILEEEAKKEENYRPTSELESTEEIEKEPRSKVGIIIIISLTVIVITLLVVLLILGKK